MSLANSHTNAARGVGNGRWAGVTRISGQSLFLAAMLLLAIGIGGYILFNETLGQAAAAPGNFKLEDIPFDGAQAYAYLKQLCDLGPRRPGRPAWRHSKNC